MKTIKLLIADDLSIIRDGVKVVLKKHENIKVVAEAKSCEEVMDYLEKNPDTVDVIVLDVDFVGSCGIEATKEIIKNNNNAKVLALTSNEDEPSIKKMINAGALGYVLKKEIRELVPALNEVAYGYKYYSKQVSVTLIDSLMNLKTEKKTVLSNREKEVLERIAVGETNKEAGEVLSVTGRTIETHRRNIKKKLGLRNTSEMIKYAVVNKLIALN